MNAYYLEPIRFPDEFKFAIGSILSNFKKHASMDNSGITLNGLSAEQSLANAVFQLVSDADEVLKNLNMVISDLARLEERAKTFKDRNPFQRYKLLLRMYFYEYSRFEDIFGHYTHWKQHKGLLTKAERKQERHAFYQAFEPAIRTRNVMMHDAITWEDQCSVPIALLQGLEATGQMAVDADGKRLSWDDHIAPLCQRTLPSLLSMGQQMRVVWNMELAHLALELVNRGMLTKATKPYVGPHAELFLKASIRNERPL